MIKFHRLSLQTYRDQQKEGQPSNNETKESHSQITRHQDAAPHKQSHVSTCRVTCTKPLLHKQTLRDYSLKCLHYCVWPEGRRQRLPANDLTVSYGPTKTLAVLCLQLLNMVTGSPALE